MIYKKFITVLVFFIVILLEISVYAFEEYVHAILNKLPEGWTLVEKKINVVPVGFYNKNNKGELYILCGPKKINWHWKDRNGNWHSEAIAFESLEIWMFKGDYRPGLKTYLTIKGPILPTKVYKSSKIIVYANPSHKLTISKDDFKGLTKKNQSQCIRMTQLVTIPYPGLTGKKTSEWPSNPEKKRRQRDDEKEQRDAVSLLTSASEMA